MTFRCVHRSLSGFLWGLNQIFIIITPINDGALNEYPIPIWSQGLTGCPSYPPKATLLRPQLCCTRNFVASAAMLRHPLLSLRAGGGERIENKDEAACRKVHCQAPLHPCFRNMPPSQGGIPYSFGIIVTLRWGSSPTLSVVTPSCSRSSMWIIRRSLAGIGSRACRRPVLMA
jgi:hypothetical protein